MSEIRAEGIVVDVVQGGARARVEGFVIDAILTPTAENIRDQGILVEAVQGDLSNCLLESFVIEAVYDPDARKRGYIRKQSHFF
jgi:hypothetical protein